MDTTWEATRGQPWLVNALAREVVEKIRVPADQPITRAHMDGMAEDNVLVEPRSFVREDGSLDLHRLLREFADFWRQHAEALAAGMAYHEVAPQLVLMAFLQRVVNGGGFVEREYGIGRGRIDLLVRWPLPGAPSPREWQREALELKVWRDKKADPLGEGLKQLEEYLARLGLHEGVLVLFDRREGREVPEVRTKFEEAVTEGGRPVVVLRA